MIDPCVHIGIARATRPGELQSGDRCVIKTSAGRTLIGVIDGIGHGLEAAQAAEVAVEVLEAFAGESVSRLLRRCHERLRGTRGAAITLVALDAGAGAAEWVGAGNVAIVLQQTESSGKISCRELMVRGGTVGSTLPSTDALKLAVRSGDTVVLATDGVRRAFVSSVTAGASAQRLADDLLARYGTACDDALVVVAQLAESSA